LIQNLRAVGIQLDASGVVRVAAYEPDIGISAVARINVSGVAICALNVLPFTVVCRFPGMTVCTDIQFIGSAATHIGAQQVALGG